MRYWIGDSEAIWLGDSRTEAMRRDTNEWYQRRLIWSQDYKAKPPEQHEEEEGRLDWWFEDSSTDKALTQLVCDTHKVLEAIAHEPSPEMVLMMQECIEGCERKILEYRERRKR